jgi:hypothetical protein
VISRLQFTITEGCLDIFDQIVYVLSETGWVVSTAFIWLRMGDLWQGLVNIVMNLQVP